MAEKKEMNIYQKLIEARKAWLKLGIKPSGINTIQEFEYYELSDIVPAITDIFKTLGLVGLFNTEGDEFGIIMTLTIINTDKPDEQIMHAVPLRDLEPIINKAGKKVTNDLQTLGAALTYTRRYLYMLALDIVAQDEVDSVNALNPKEERKTEKREMPKTETERKEIAKDLTDTEAPADEAMVAGVKKALKAVIKDIDNCKNKDDIKRWIDEIQIQTAMLTKLTKSQGEKIIKHCKEIINKANGVEE